MSCASPVARSKVKVRIRTYSLCISFSENCSCPAHNFVVTNAHTDPVFHPSVRPSVNISDHSNIDPTVQVCNSETLRDTLDTLGTNIKYF